MSARTIELTVKDEIATITLNRPEKRNALRSRDFADLGAALDQTNDDPLIKAVILTGTPPSFCAGADLTETDIPDIYAHVGAVQRCAMALSLLAKPTLAVVNGAAVGAGMALALGCDLVIASDTATMREVFIERGLTLDFGTSALLLARLGPHVAKELSYFGETLSAQQLVQLGLVNRLVSQEQLEQTALAWANKLASPSPRAITATKHLLDSHSRSFGQALALEQIAQASVIPTVDFADWKTSLGEGRGE